MAKYSLSELTSIFLPKNVRKTKDNLPESKATLVPWADAIQLYQLISDANEYLGVPMDSTALPTASTAGQFPYWDGSAWDVAKEYTYSTIPGAGSVVTLPYTPILSLPTRVYLNGQLKHQSQDYTMAANVITFTIVFAPTDRITVTYHK